jgi:hypothetical protein
LILSENIDKFNHVEKGFVASMKNAVRILHFLETGNIISAKKDCTL